ncbi:MAG TPA: GNAT family N-acetyltransferase [Candidatus Nanopelagicales bacterium]|nr:GNAT family N-acetyltransferase [Candidatus Nanopelagicales bacterium]
MAEQPESPAAPEGDVRAPAHWASDVVLSDGRTVHVRPIRPDDADELVRFHESLSEETIYYRFFAPYPHLTKRDIRRFTQVDNLDRVALVATVGERFVAVGRYDVVAPGTAELAFTVHDRHQGRGLGSVLLEHLAAVARESGLCRFVAEVLPSNNRMLATFVEAGYKPTQHVSDGVVSLTFEIQPTPASLAVRASREHRSEARSIARLLSPTSVAVVGAGRGPVGLGRELLRHIVEGGFTGTVVAVNPRVPSGEQLGGVATYPRLADVPHEIDLVVVVVPAPEVQQVVRDAAAVGAVGLVVLSAGFAEVGELGRARQADLVALARGHGMRVVGPNALGLINTDPAVRLNASAAPRLPERGIAGFFSQSGSLGGAILERAARRGLGISTFVSAGNRADVSGNDLMQYWEDDASTGVVLLYLESIGNPRKFTRIARRLSQRKPVVAIRSGRSTQALPLGHRVRRSTLPAAAVDAMFSQSGVMQTETLAELFDVAALLTHQPLPQGPRVAVISNSDAMALLAADALESHDLLVCGEPDDLPPDVSAAQFASALNTAVADPTVHAILAVHVSPFGGDTSGYVAAIIAAAEAGTTPVLAVTLGNEDDRGLLGEGPSAVPKYDTVEDAVKALAVVVPYVAWRNAPSSEPPDLPGIRVEEADRLLGRLVAELPSTDRAAELRLRVGEGDDELSELLGAYGIEVEPSALVDNATQAVQAARRLGYPVSLTVTDPELERRVDGVGVRLDLYNDRALRGAWKALAQELGPGRHVERTIQRMVPRGVDCRIGSVEDPSFGPVVALTVGGAVPQLLGDRSYRIPPLTAADADALIRSPRVEPLLRQLPPEARAGLATLLVRVGRLAVESPEVSWLVLDPVLVSAAGPVVLAARARVRRPGTRTDGDARRLLQ